MNYARKFLALLLVFCVVLNLTSAVFAEGSDEELPPDGTVVEEEPAPEETEPPDGETPGDGKPPDETAPEETEAVPEETTEQPTEETGEAPPEEAAGEETPTRMRTSVLFKYSVPASTASSCCNSKRKSSRRVIAWSEATWRSNKKSSVFAGKHKRNEIILRDCHDPCGVSQ